MSDDVSLILQFGTGRFLRAFVEMFVQEVNDTGEQSWGVVAVQSTPGLRAGLINGAEDGYPVCVRGMQDGETIDRTCQVQSLSGAIVAQEDWEDVLALARDARLSIVTSNATEASYVLDPSDGVDDMPPKSYPGKLTRCLLERFTNGMSGLTIAPCELVERNGKMLQSLVLGQAEAWGLDDDFVEWLNAECVWLNTMVDRMVVPPTADDPLVVNELCAVAEPFSLWVIERVEGKEEPFLAHPGIVWVDDIDASFLRKVRILNGAHTAMVAKYMPQGYRTVRDVMADADARDWVRGLIFEEIVPCTVGRTDEAALFAFQTLDRLSNPFFEHKLEDIAMGHEAKVKIRLESSFDDYVRLYDEEPVRLREAIARKLL